MVFDANECEYCAHEMNASKRTRDYARVCVLQRDLTCISAYRPIYLSIYVSLNPSHMNGFLCAIAGFDDTHRAMESRDGCLPQTALTIKTIHAINTHTHTLAAFCVFRIFTITMRWFCLWLINRLPSDTVSLRLRIFVRTIDGAPYSNNGNDEPNNAVSTCGMCTNARARDTLSWCAQATKNHAYYFMFPIPESYSPSRTYDLQIIAILMHPTELEQCYASKLPLPSVCLEWCVCVCGWGQMRRAMLWLM